MSPPSTAHSSLCAKPSEPHFRSPARALTKVRRSIGDETSTPISWYWDGVTLLSEMHPSAEALCVALGEVLDALHGPTNPGAAVDAALDTIVRVLGAERGLLLVTDGRADQIRHARSDAGALPLSEWEEISRTVVRDAREAGQTRVWDAFDSAGDAASMRDIGILSAAATPVRGGPAGLRGVLYVDIRRPGQSFGPAHERFLDTAASILGLALRTDRAERATGHKAKPHPDAPPLSLAELVASPSMAQVADSVEAALASDLNVLVRGPSGAGKTALAIALAEALGRGKTVRATLGSSDDLNTITSELFGHERGAFSGATARRVGLVEHAHRGVLILDEVLNLPAHAQQLLLDFTQFGTYRPLGYEGSEPRRADVRIIAATQGDLDQAIAQGRFRSDLYYRLAGIELHLPSVAERRSEIPGIAEALLQRADPERGWRLSLPVRRLLARGTHPWRGNLRELEALVARARYRALSRASDTKVIMHADVAAELGAPVAVGTPSAKDTMLGDALSVEDRWAALEREREALSAREAEVLATVLREEGGVVSRAARRVGLPRTTLIHRLQLLGVTPDA